MIIPSIMSDQTVAILGLSRSGMASAKALTAAGARVFAYDDHAEPDLPEGAEFSNPQDWPWDDLSAMVISPGIPHLHPAPHPAAVMANENNVPIISDIELLMLAKPKAKIIGVTGTNGKSTVVSLINHIFDVNGIQSVLGGNIGTPALALTDPLEDGVIILELSSYQLETTPSLQLDAGAVITITPDHLDRHGGWDGYVAAKAILAKSTQGCLVLGNNETASSLTEFAPSTGMTKVIIADGEDAPDRHDAPNLTGPHNALNTVIASHVVQHFGLTEGDILAALSSFKGLQHRMEHIAQSGSIQFINDSKATNGEAAAEALKSFDNIYWIAGGMAKDSGLGPAKSQLDDVRAAYLIGASATSFADELDGYCPHQIAKTLDQATQAAFVDAANANDDSATILLSPAAASFDQFNSFEERGDCFRDIVMKLLATQTEEAHHV